MSPSSAHCQLYHASHYDLCVYMSNQYAHDFFQVISIPNVLLKTLSSPTNSLTYQIFPLIINNKSSAYCDLFCCLFPHGREIPLSLPFVTAFQMVCVRASPTMKKRYDARGQHCLTSLSILKLEPGLTLR